MCYYLRNNTHAGCFRKDNTLSAKAVVAFLSGLSGFVLFAVRCGQGPITRIIQESIAKTHECLAPKHLHNPYLLQMLCYYSQKAHQNIINTNRQEQTVSELQGEG